MIIVSRFATRILYITYSVEIYKLVLYIKVMNKLIKNIILAALTLTIASCAQLKEDLVNGPTTSEYDAEILEARNEIKDATGINLDVSGLVVVVMERPNIAATCSKYEGEKHGEKVLTISPEVYKKRTKEARHVTLIHELGHCYLNLKHIENSSPGFVADIMARYLNQAMVRKYLLTPEMRAPFLVEMVQRSDWY